MLVIFLIVPFASSHIVCVVHRLGGWRGRRIKNETGRVSTLLKIDTYNVSLLWMAYFIVASFIVTSRTPDHRV